MSEAITIVGLGPGHIDQLTVGAWRALQEADCVYLRTSRHLTVEDLPAGCQYISFDDLYEQHDRLEDVHEQIARRIVGLAQSEPPVLYAVPGHPLVGEATTLRIQDLARESGIAVRIIDGMSAIEPVAATVGADPLAGLQIADASLLAAKHHPNLDPDVAAIVLRLESRSLAADVKMTLLSLYHDDHPVTLVYAAGRPEQRTESMPLYEIDRQSALDLTSALYIPALTRPGSISSYQDIVAALRAPGGCPWDREQTHQTLRTHLLEETYEVLAALDSEDTQELMEELGDLLLQVLLHAQIASEDGEFKLSDSCRYAMEKLVRRHPHVFTDATVQDSDEVLRNWEQIKREERGDTFRSMLAGINKALPALSQAMEIQRRVARVGFDWAEEAPVRDKVQEELLEFADATTDDERTREFGDLLFALVNLARWKGIDPESALRAGNGRFMRRFEAIEQHALQTGVALEDMTLEQMDAIWELAKKGETD